MEDFLFEIQYFSVLIEHFAGFAAVSCNGKLVNNGKTKGSCDNTMVLIRKLLGMF